MISVFDNPLTSGFFGDAEGQAPWSAERQIAHIIAFEAALTRACVATGRVEEATGAAALDALSRFEVDWEDLRRGSAQDGLPVPALIRQMREAAGPAGAAIHTGSTSQDVLDTALTLTLREVTALVLRRLEDVTQRLDALMEAHGPNQLMGRTRMQAALPITVRDRIRPVRAALATHRTRMEADRPWIEALQLGGAVGTNAAFGADAGAIRTAMAAELGLSNPAEVWHTDRSRIVSFANALSLITGTMGKFGQDVALMAQQGLGEARLAGGGGSSAMPHKSNPVLAEQLVTLARFNGAQAGVLHGAMIHEQERSGSAWALEWMVLPQICVATCRALGSAATLSSSILHMGTPS